MNITDLFSGVLGGVVVSLLDFMFFRHQNTIENRLTMLEDDKFAKLEKRVDEHCNADQSQKILATLEAMEKTAEERQRSVTGRLETLTSKVDRSLQQQEGLTRDVENNHSYIDNLRRDLQAHVSSTGRR